MRKILRIIILSVAVTGCSNSSSPSNSETKTEDLSYEFEYNGCKTGKQQFSSTADLCKGLQNNTLNNNCAGEMREEHFKSHCQGQTFKAFDQTPQSRPEASTNETVNTPIKTKTEDQTLPSKPIEPQEEVKQEDKLVGETLVRTILPGEASLVLYLNPTNESTSSMIFCVADAQSAKDLLRDSRMGGIILARGAKVILKNDKSNSFRDGTSLKGTYIQVNCK